MIFKHIYCEKIKPDDAFTAQIKLQHLTALSLKRCRYIENYLNLLE